MVGSKWELLNSYLKLNRGEKAVVFISGSTDFGGNTYSTFAL